MGIPTYFGGVINPNDYDNNGEHITLTCQTCGQKSEEKWIKGHPTLSHAIFVIGWFEIDGKPCCPDCSVGQQERIGQVV